MRTFWRTFSASFALIIGLTACQTLGIEEDKEAATKSILVAASFMVDAVGIYGHLPPCPAPDPCRKDKAYQDAKLIALATVAAFEPVRDGQRSSVFLSAALLYSQYQIAKTLANAPAPTAPEASPPPATLQYLEAAGLTDILISTAHQRVQDAVSVNTSVDELLNHLSERVAALP